MIIDTNVTKFPITKAWEKGQKAVKEGKMMVNEILESWFRK